MDQTTRIAFAVARLNGVYFASFVIILMTVGMGVLHETFLQGIAVISFNKGKDRANQRYKLLRWLLICYTNISKVSRVCYEVSKDENRRRRESPESRGVAAREAQQRFRAIQADSRESCQNRRFGTPKPRDITNSILAESPYRIASESSTLNAPNM